MACMYRIAEEEDIPVLMNLIRELTYLEKDFDYNPQAHKEGLKLLLKQDKARAIIIVAETEGYVVGMCSGQVVTSTAIGSASVWIEDVVVTQEYRGMGIGKGLLSSIEHWAKEFAGAGRVQLVSDKNNTQAFDFYTKTNWSHSDLIVLKKDLRHYPQQPVNSFF